jgi:DoxX-like family
MNLAAVIVTVLLATLLAWSAIRKLSHREEVVQSYARLGVPEDKLNYLAILLLAGALGLLLGLAWSPLGMAAATCLIGYFVVAVAFHVRAKDTKNVITPLVLMGLAAASLALRLASH